MSVQATLASPEAGKNAASALSALEESQSAISRIHIDLKADLACWEDANQTPYFDVQDKLRSLEDVDTTPL